MNQINDYPPEGLCRPQRDFLRDRHQRALCIGGIQFAFSSFYLCLAMFEIYYDFPKLKSYWNATENYDQLFWLTLRDIEGLLHFYSSMLILHACMKSPNEKLKAIKYCKWSKWINMIFFLYEVIVLMCIYQYWQLGVYFILYRLWFNHEVTALLKTVRILSPPPPGHYC